VTQQNRAVGSADRHAVRLLHDPHPDWDVHIQRFGDKDCCALVIDERWIWSPNEHIGSEVALRIARILLDDMREVDWHGFKELEATKGRRK